MNPYIRRSRDMSVRYCDIDIDNKKLPPVYGHLSSPLVPLEVSLEKIIPLIDNLQRYVKIAKQHCYSSDHLTKEESAALYLYSMERGDRSFYRVLNKALRDENRAALKPWFPYLKLLDTALNKLPSKKLPLWRGVDADVSSSFQEGQLLTWCFGSSSIVAKKKVILADSASYDGDTVNDVPNGTGVCAWPTGTHYTGKWQGGKKHGRGVQTWGKDTDWFGDRYDGEWQDGKMHGQGVYTYANGDRYDGEWLDSKMHGRGVYTYAKGDRYDGEWQDDKMHGRGVCTCGNGD
ncbi:unnamed protein product, partial [Didymodactylos carnosus]